jgi:hypothetical protein
LAGNATRWLAQTKRESLTCFRQGVPLANGATTALPPTKEEIDKSLEIAPNYRIEIMLPSSYQNEFHNCFESYTTSPQGKTWRSI